MPPFIMMADLCRAHILVSGSVQGVGYRAFSEREARETGVSGFSRNLGDGDVEIEVEGERDHIERFIERLRKGPPLARVSDLEVSWGAYRGDFTVFNIIV